MFLQPDSSPLNYRRSPATPTSSPKRQWLRKRSAADSPGNSAISVRIQSPEDSWSVSLFSAGQSTCPYELRACRGAGSRHSASRRGKRRMSNLAPNSFRARSRSSPNLQLAKFVAEGLRRPRNVAVGFRLYRRLIHGSRLAKKIHNLIACPAFRVDPCVHNQSHGPEKFRGKPAVVRNGILVETYFFPKLFCVQRPSLRYKR